MNPTHEILGRQLKQYGETLKGLRSYVKELKEMTAKHGTDTGHFEEDLMEAEHNVKYYETEIARIKREMTQMPGDERLQPPADTILPRTVKQGIAPFILSSISFVAGAIVGARLKSSRSSSDRAEGKREH
jgi:hypothetical protein